MPRQRRATPHTQAAPTHPADGVRPPGDAHAAPLGEQRRVVLLRLGHGADGVGEGEGGAEVAEAHAALQHGHARVGKRRQLPGAAEGLQARGDVGVAERGCAAAARHAAAGGERG
jgi:hypothetical protein